MAPRPTWKGSLKLSLITIPIRLFPATNPGADVAFRQLHRTCHTPIQLKKWCPHCEEEVGKDDIVKGYEREKGRFVVVEEEEIAGLRPESSHVVDISHVLEASAVDPVYVERTYYAAPENKAAGPAFAVVRDGLSGQAAVGRMTQHGREYLVAIAPRESALLLSTLRTAGEVRDMNGIAELDHADVKVKSDEVKLARQVLNSLATAPDLSGFVDNYQLALRRMLKAKGAGEYIARAEPAPTKVVNLMDALRQSLAAVNSQKQRPARAAPRKSARVIRHPAGKRTRKAG
jgi:DNA end-binding protein Ku